MCSSGSFEAGFIHSICLIIFLFLVILTPFLFAAVTTAVEVWLLRRYNLYALFHPSPECRRGGWGRGRRLCHLWLQDWLYDMIFNCGSFFLLIYIVHLFLLLLCFCFFMSRQQWKFRRCVCICLVAAATGMALAAIADVANRQTLRLILLFICVRCIFPPSISVLFGHGSSIKCGHEAAVVDSTAMVGTLVAAAAAAATKIVEVAGGLVYLTTNSNFIFRCRHK